MANQQTKIQTEIRRLLSKNISNRIGKTGLDRDNAWLAERSSLQKSTIGKIIKCEVGTSVDSLYLIAKGLGCEAWELLFSPDESDKQSNKGHRDKNENKERHTDQPLRNRIKNHSDDPRKQNDGDRRFEAAPHLDKKIGQHGAGHHGELTETNFNLHSHTSDANTEIITELRSGFARLEKELADLKKVLRAKSAYSRLESRTKNK